jgi:hypothetical protein
MPKSASVRVRPTLSRSTVTAPMAAAALPAWSAAVSPAPSANATSARRSWQAARLNRSTCGSTTDRAAPCAMPNRLPSEWPMAWQMPSPVLAMAAPARCAASSIWDLASRSAPSATARGR